MRKTVKFLTVACLPKQQDAIGSLETPGSSKGRVQGSIRNHIPPPPPDCYDLAKSQDHEY
jgi:hypothetical protein